MLEDKNFQNLKWIAALIIIGAFTYLSWKIISPFIYVLIWSSIIAMIFMPLYKYILKKIKSKNFSAIITLIIIIIIVIIPLLFFGLLAVKELKVAISSLKIAVEKIMSDPIWGERLKKWLDWAQEKMPIEDIGAYLSNILLNNTGYLINNVIGLVVSVCFSIFTLFFIFRDSDDIKNAIMSFLPFSDQKKQQILDKISNVVSASVNGIVIIAVLQGILGAFILWVLRINAPLFWGMIIIILSVIPLLGASIIWLPISGYFIFNGMYVKAAILISFGILVMSSVDNFLRPKLVGQRAKMHELMIFFSVLGGIKLFGILGILLGPVIFSITVSLLSIIRNEE